jgi:predicted aminopeptidase
VVGALPYIGFFDRASADEEAGRLEELGWEVHVRPAGAYSTLGWFRDPLWRSMLRWDVEGFANTVLHELAHATLWIPGEGKFNESFATFVGDESSARFMEEIREERPEAYTTWQDRTADSVRYREFMHALYERLDALYRTGLGREAVLTRKAKLIEDARTEYAALPWRRESMRSRLDPGRTVNNASLVQFRVYSTGLDVFDEALQRFAGDLPALLRAAQELPNMKKRAEGPWNPYDAMASLSP